jgi:predicted SAM-dependent methyltransferase
VSFAQADLFYLPYRDNCFDVVFNDGVIEHFSLTDYPNYKDALREMVRVAKPGGKIIVDVPNWHCFAHTLYKWVLKKTGKKYEYGYEKSFRRNELIDLFKEFNLTHLELQSYDSAHGVYRLRAYSRLFSWLGLALYALDTPALANRIGYMVLIKGIKHSA